MGDVEAGALVPVESSLKYHPDQVGILTWPVTRARTLSGGQFDWGGRLQKSNGGARRFPQADWKPAVECKGKRELDCESDGTSRCESRS